MSDAFNVWPRGVPQAYGDVAFPSPEERQNIALSGLNLLSDFNVAFYIGFAFIALFSITRFNQRIDEGPEAVGQPAVLSQLSPMDMRDRRLILQAYSIYVLILLVLYWLLTFYGKVILTFINTTLPTAGFTTDTSGFDFQSPNWPLFVALSMIGVLPVLRPVDALERRLRRWTHAIVGIPVHIYSNARKLRDELRGHLKKAWESSTHRKAPMSGAFYTQTVPDWVRNVAVDKAGVDYAFEAREQLEKLATWAKYGRGNWPSEDRSSAYESLLARTVDDGFAVMNDFDDLVQNKHIDEPPAAPANSKLSPEQVRINQQNRLEREWQTLSGAVVEMRDTLLCLLSVGAEKQRNYTLIADASLWSVINEAIPQSGEQRGPQAAIGLSLIPIFMVYVVAISAGYHAPVGTFGSSTFATWAVSGLIETIKFAAIFLFPLVVVLNYRHVRVKLQAWTDLKPFDFSQGAMAQLLWAAIIAYAVAALCLSLLAVAQVYLVARSPASAAYQLLDGEYPQIFISLGLAGITIPFSIAVLYAVDIKKAAAEKKAADDKKKAIGAQIGGGVGYRTWAALLVLGAMTLGVTFLVQATHLHFWFDQYLSDLYPPNTVTGDSTTDGAAEGSTTSDGAKLWFSSLWFDIACSGRDEPFLFDLFKLPLSEVTEKKLADVESCSRFYSLASFLIYALTSFLAVTLYLPKTPSAGGKEAAS